MARRLQPIYGPPVAGEPLCLREDGHWSTEGLVAYWPINEMRGTVVRDATGRGPGTMLRPWAWCAGGLSGSRDLLTAIDGGLRPLPAAGATVLLRVAGGMPADLYQHMISVRDSDIVAWSIGAHIADGGRRVWMGGASSNLALALVSVAQLTEARWYNVACVYEGTVGTIYVDGELDSSGTIVGMGAAMATVPVCIGARWNVYPTSGAGWDGCIGRTSLYGRALSAVEIAALHATPDLPIWRPRAGISLIGLPELWLLDGDAQTTGAADAQATRIMLPHADAGARGDVEAQAARTFGTRGDAAATGVAEATVTRTLTAAGDAAATAAAEAVAARIMLLYVDAASQSDAEAGAALTHSATGDAAAGGNAEAAAGAVLLITGDAAAAGHAEAAAALAHLLFGDAAASALAEATPSLAASLDGDAADMAGASGVPQIAYLLHGDAQAISSAAEEQLVRAVLLPIAATDVQRLVVEATALARTGIGAAQLSRDELSAESLATLRVIADELRRHGIDVDLL